MLTTGFIQANTAGTNALGGDIRLDVSLLVASGNTLLIGDDTAAEFQPGRFGFNVIQASAPDGVRGDISISAPALDLAGSLSMLDGNVLNSGGLGRNPCQNVHGSSFGSVGRGALRVGVAFSESRAAWTTPDLYAAVAEARTSVRPMAGGCMH